MRERDGKVRLSDHQTWVLGRYCVALERIDRCQATIYAGDTRSRWWLDLANRCAFSTYQDCHAAGLSWLANELLLKHRNPAAAKLLERVAQEA